MKLFLQAKAIPRSTSLGYGTVSELSTLTNFVSA